MDLLVDLVNSQPMLKKLFDNEIPCEKVEIHIADFCKLMAALKDAKIDDKLLNQLGAELGNADKADGEDGPGTGANPNGGTNATGADGSGANGSGSGADGAGAGSESGADGAGADGAGANGANGADKAETGKKSMADALASLTKEELIQAIKNTLKLDKEKALLTLIFNNSVFKVKGMQEGVAQKIFTTVDKIKSFIQIKSRTSLKSRIQSLLHKFRVENDFSNKLKNFQKKKGLPIPKQAKA